MPVRIAALASCTARTSCWLKCTPGASTAARLPSTSDDVRMLGRRCRPPSSRMPARRSAATASITPEPHRPTGLPVADHVDLDAAVFDRNALDRAFRRPHAAGDVAAFERRPRRAGGGHDVAAVDQRNLGIGADIHDQVVVAAAPMLLRGEQRGDVVAADEAADIRRQMDIGAGADRQIELARLDVHGVAHGGDERRAAELAHRQPEQQVMHGGIAADRHVDDVGRASRRWHGTGRGRAH